MSDIKLVVSTDSMKTVTVSYDEKPEIQAIGNTCTDRNPTLKHGFWLNYDRKFLQYAYKTNAAGYPREFQRRIPLTRAYKKYMRLSDTATKRVESGYQKLYK